MTDKRTQHEKSLLEWLTGALGLAITLGLLGFIGWEAIRSSDEPPPAIEIETDRIAPAGAGYVVEFTARNRSDNTAAAVEIEGTLRGTAPQPVVSTATLDYVPSRSSRSGGLYFPNDPRRGSLELRALGYAAP